MSNYPIGRLHPKVAVVMIGTNNIHNTAEEIAAGVKAILDKTQTMFPGIKIIVTSILPNRRANDLMMAATPLCAPTPTTKASSISTWCRSCRRSATTGKA